MSDTPRTEAVKVLFREHQSLSTKGEYVSADFARQLERELAFVRKELSEARDMEMMKAQQCTAERLRANAAEQELAKARKADKFARDLCRALNEGDGSYKP